jgi:hypothetical protein
MKILLIISAFLFFSPLKSYENLIMTSPNSIRITDYNPLVVLPESGDIIYYCDEKIWIFDDEKKVKHCILFDSVIHSEHGGSTHLYHSFFWMLLMYSMMTRAIYISILDSDSYK